MSTGFGRAVPAPQMSRFRPSGVPWVRLPQGTPYRLCEWVLSRTGELVSVSRATNARSDTPVDRFDGPHTALVPVRTFFSNLPGALWSGAMQAHVAQLKADKLPLAVPLAM